jgi:hypothetical protein
VRKAAVAQSVLRLATELTIHRPEFDPHIVQNHSAAQPSPIFGIWALSLGAKRPGRETDHWSNPSAEVKNTWTYNPLPDTPSWLSA